MPSGDWLVPSIKFLPKSNSYGHWPASGEIDLVESRGNRELIKNGVNIGGEQITSSLHFGPYPKADAWQITSFPRASSEKGKGFNNAFHRFRLHNFDINLNEFPTILQISNGVERRQNHIQR